MTFVCRALDMIYNTTLKFLIIQKGRVYILRM